MGSCWCKDKTDEREMYSPTAGPASASMSLSPGDARLRAMKALDPSIVDQLVMEMLTLIASFVDNDEESPVLLVKLHVIADKEEGWLQVVSSMVNVIPLDNPLGPSAITIVFDDCPLPSRDSVIKLTKLFRLSRQRALSNALDVKMKRNMCVVLGCIAEKLAGPNSVAVLTEETLDFLLAFLDTNFEPCIVLFALIALEKFAHTTENKLVIRSRFDKEDVNPLLKLEKLANNEDYVWRQVGFCAQWALDNLFVIENRPLSYETVDMTPINVILNSHDVSEYLKISCNGLEARCDSYSFESVRCTFQVDNGCWYYEVTIVTPGVMQIGWATKNSHFLNHEGYGIGDDLYSLSYDGCRKLIWYKAKPASVQDLPEWQPGDILGCLIDLNTREAIFSLNGRCLTPCTEIFETTRCCKQGFFAAASFMAFQQCRFNFGHLPFSFPPTDRPFMAFNDYARLTDEEKKVLPRRYYLEKVRNASIPENACTLCYDAVADCTLEPCFHKGFCSKCAAQLRECPLCRAPILNVKRDI
ncbi:RING finger and SPRY domain-containing protein 1 isoform X1 [Bombyx mori]|uniref:RING finger and SPRY domain-containing protein 1 n=1 Tax=Bombyx mori TaxID=7091 RepID=A0A8R2GA29_BOMMO|nr:RING finger and SPRY domain-containing protein 1 isoform X1 [Bombyx mori]XP_012549043.1 RING finger and SPRY domain-containing protein 1 isoform X1 [Bombyx mori]